MTNIAANCRAVAAQIKAACAAAGRDPAGVAVVAVGKTFPAAALREAHRAGLRHFGENYLQEARTKMTALADLPLVWHFIGAIQANKTAPIASAFAWAHTVDRLKIARRLSAARAALMQSENAPPLKICLAVNLDDEKSKSGVAPAALADLAAAVVGLPGLRLGGLMAIPAPRRGAARQRAAFAEVRKLRDAVAVRENIALDALSMGMSGDYAAAIAEGATMVRIGAAIFGPREQPAAAERRKPAAGK